MERSDVMSIQRKRCCGCDHFQFARLVLKTCPNLSSPRVLKQSEVVELEEVVVMATIAMIEEIVDSKTVVAEEAGNVEQHLLPVEISTIMEQIKVIVEVDNGHEEKLLHLNRIAEEEVVEEGEVVAVKARHISMALLRHW